MFGCGQKFGDVRIYFLQSILIILMVNILNSCQLSTSASLNDHTVTHSMVNQHVFTSIRKGSFIWNKHLFVLIHIRNKRWGWYYKTRSSLQWKYFYWRFKGNATFLDLFCYLCFMYIMFSCLIFATLWSPAGKGLPSWLSCMWCLLVFGSLSHVESVVRCCTWLYRILICAFFLTLTLCMLGYFPCFCCRLPTIGKVLLEHLNQSAKCFKSRSGLTFY